jgi:hypothetical protein
MKRTAWWGVSIVAIAACLGYLIYSYFFAFCEVSAAKLESLIREGHHSTFWKGTSYGGTIDGYHYFIHAKQSSWFDERIKVRADDLRLPESIVRPFEQDEWSDFSWYFPEPAPVVPQRGQAATPATTK